MKWFQIKEQAAGKKRLLISWYLYKIFGKNILYFIAFIMSVFTILFSKSIRNYSKKYLSIIQTHSKIKPNIINQLKHINSYADSLVDKILMYSGDYDINNIFFENETDKENMYKDINNGHGVFFITNHIGNIEVLQTFFYNKIKKPNFSVNIFISKKQSKIFNNFLDRIKLKIPVNLFDIEDISANTGIELKEILDNGGVVFIAGDRLSETNYKKSIKTYLFNHCINLPKGTFKLTKLMNVPTYFISAIKQNKKYQIYLEKQAPESEKNLMDLYTQYLEKIILKAPFQFFHFYDFFTDTTV